MSQVRVAGLGTKNSQKKDMHRAVSSDIYFTEQIFYCQAMRKTWRFSFNMDAKVPRKFELGGDRCNIFVLEVDYQVPLLSTGRNIGICSTRYHSLKRIQKV